MLDTPSPEGNEGAEQRYKAVLAVVAEGRTVKEVARDWGGSRQTLHSWLARYEAEGRRITSSFSGKIMSYR